MREIVVASDNTKDKLQVQISMCLQILYELEDITDYEERVISNCIDFLQNINVISAKDIAEDILKEMGEKNE